jgi:nucleoside-diphosphate-sugar epimerase
VSTALVTGAAGFVGRHFTAHLREHGWKVYAIDTRYHSELTDVIDTREFFSGPWPDWGFDLVIHAAAVVGGRAVIEGRPLAQSVNFEIDASMFRWAVRRRPGRVVYFSSSAAYPVGLQGRQQYTALTENDASLISRVGMPDELYGWAKVTGEILAAKARQAGASVTVVRPFSGYGDDQGPDYPFGAFIGRALRREDPFLIWGDGEQVRDFIHIDDIMAAVMAMYEQERNGPVNLGTGIPTSMRQLAGKVCEAAGYDPEFEYVPSAPAGVRYRVAQVSALESFYRPRVTLDEGIRRALRARLSD